MSGPPARSKLDSLALRLVHFGTFDVENYGDLLYPLIARHRLAAAGVDITFVSPVGGPPVWSDCVPTVQPSAVIEDEVDGVMLGGGNIVHAGQAGVDAYRRSGLTALLAYTRLWLDPSKIANARGVPLCWNTPGVPQAMTPRAGEVLRWAAAKASYLSVRDAPSLRNMRHAGVAGSVEVVPDSALEVAELWTDAELEEAREALFAEAGQGIPERTIVAHLNQRYTSGPAQSLAERLDRVAERLDATPVLLALGPCHGDGGVARSVGAKMKSEPVVVDRPAGLRQIVAGIAGADAYLGSSMHGMITALAFGCPGILVAREGAQGGKFSGFLSQFQLGRWLVPSWAEAEESLNTLLDAGPADAARVLPAAKPSLDAHWARMAEMLLGGKPSSRFDATSSPAPSVDGILEEGVDALLAAVDNERRRAAVESARADRAVRQLAEAGRDDRSGAVEKRLAEIEATHKSGLEEQRVLKQRLAELRAARAHAENELQAVKSTGAERDLELQRRITELEILRAAAEQRLEGATAEIDRRAGDTRALTEILAQREDTFRAAMEAYAEASRTVARLEGDLAKAHARHADAQAVAGRLEAVEPQLEDARAQLAESRRRLTERDVIVSRLGEAIEQARADQMVVEERLRAADTEVAEADRAAHELETEIDRTSTEMEDLRSANKESLAREQALHKRLVLERDGLEERLEATLVALNDARLPSTTPSAVEVLEAERDQLRAELLIARAATQGLEEHLAALRQEIGDRVRPAENGPGGRIASSPDGTPSQRLIAFPDSTDPEADTRAEFFDRYAELWRAAGLEHLPEPERALPWPFFPVRAEGRGNTRASVIVCVHNALDDVRRCLASVARHLTVDAEILLVDDGSDPDTADFLESVVAEGGRVRLIANREPPHGYTIAANLGLRAAVGEYLVLLNSDTIVTAGWLERLIACAESDPSIGIVGPVSNAASHQSVPKVREDGEWATNPLPEWLTVDGMGVAVASASPLKRPHVPFINGYCYMISRRALDAVGFLDEDNFAAGYCEENDFSLRAREEGFTGAIADDAFVFHAKSRSYTPEGRNEHARQNYSRFLEKHGPETVRQLVDSLEATPPVGDLGHRLEKLLGDRTAVVSEVHERLGAPVRPVFVLPGIAQGGSGGSHSIVQEVAGMRQIGVPAQIAISDDAAERVRAAYPDDLDLFTPYSGTRSLSDIASNSNVLIATHSDSVPLVRTVLSQRPELLAAYYVQDYEPFFWEEGSENARRALASYTALENPCLFAKTHWLCNVVSAAHGVPVHKVEPSIDRTIYRPADSESEGAEAVVIAAMIRLRTPRRQPRATLRLLERLVETFGQRVEIITFGCPQDALERLTDMTFLRERHRGMLSRPAVAELLREADAFVDHSTYQAFGRTALEAMACGCVPIVPATGGAWEFAQHDVNALVCETLDETDGFSAASRFIEDMPLRKRLRQAGLGTAARYSVERAAMSEFALFASVLLLRQQTGKTKGLVARVG